MAYSLKITDGTTTLDLLNGTFRLSDQGFEWKTGTEPIWTTFELVARDAAQADIRTWRASIMQLREKARKYHERITDRTPVWIYYQSEGGTERRCLIYDMELSVPSGQGGFMSPLLAVGTVKLMLTIKRAWYLENTTATTISTTNVSSIGGTWIPGAIAGDTLARIIQFKATWDGGGGGGHRLWVGVRPVREGSAGFVSVWEVEDGTNGTDASDAADAAASDGNRVTVDFGTVTTLATRATVKLSDVSASNYDDMVGEYLILLRAKCSSVGTKARVKLLYGLGSADIEAGDAYISGTGYATYELGKVTLPPYGYRNANQNLSDFQFAIKAELLDGTDDLYLDALVLIPAEHMAFINIGTFVGATDKVTLFTSTDGINSVELQTVSATPDGYYGLEHVTKDFYLPTDGGIIVICDRVESNTYDLEIIYNPRVELLS